MLKMAIKFVTCRFSFSAIPKIWSIGRFVLWMNHWTSIGSIPSTSLVYTRLIISSLIHWPSYTVIWTILFRLEMLLFRYFSKTRIYLFDGIRRIHNLTYRASIIIQLLYMRIIVFPYIYRYRIFIPFFAEYLKSYICCFQIRCTICLLQSLCEFLVILRWHIFNWIPDQMHDAELYDHLREDGLRSLFKSADTIHRQEEDVFHSSWFDLVKDLYPLVLAFTLADPISQVSLFFRWDHSQGPHIQRILLLHNHCAALRISSLWKRIHSTSSKDSFAILPIQGPRHLWCPISFHGISRSRKYPRLLQRCLFATYRVHTWPVLSFRLQIHLFSLRDDLGFERTITIPGHFDLNFTLRGL